jgi:putative FmdB family regulatory protein
MPLYEYECEKCGHRFEKIQKFSDPPETACPKCGGAVHKLIAAPAFQLKGTGWYITDYARKNSGGEKDSKPAKAEQGSKTSESSTTSSTGDAAKTSSSPTSGSSTLSTGTPSSTKSSE